jgi:glycosyltransferase involved in cell wall biosynthesis
MLIAGLGLTGTPRMMMDIIENINYRKFEVSIAYKPEYPRSELDLLEDLNNMGIELVPLKGKRLFDFRGIFHLYRHLKKNSTHVVHCWDELGIAARLLSIFLGFRVIASHCNPVISKGSFFFYFLNKITSILIDGLIFCTQGVQDNYKKNKTIFLHNKKIALINNCINTSKIPKNVYQHAEIKQKWGIDEKDFILTNIGYFNEQKGQTYLLYSLKMIFEKIPEAKLIIVGWGPLEKTLRILARELQVESQVIFAGKCERDIVFEILSITDVFVLSSLWEGFGLVLAEAMAMAKPVVSTHTDGSKLVVQHNKTGLIVPPKNPRDLADAVTDLHANPEWREEMGLLGKKRVTTLFSPDKFVLQHELFYKKVLQSK